MKYKKNKDKLVRAQKTEDKLAQFKYILTTQHEPCREAPSAVIFLTNLLRAKVSVNGAIQSFLRRHSTTLLKYVTNEQTIKHSIQTHVDRSKVLLEN